MKNLFVGIDISKEKLNLCCQKDLKTVLEEEVANDVKPSRKPSGYPARHFRQMWRMYSSARSTLGGTFIP